MSDVQLVEVKVMVPKEMLDVKTAIVEILKDIKAGKTAMEIAGENLAGLMGAMDGMDKLALEAKDAAAYDLGALLAADVAKVLTGKA